jgi:hypothetical protein
MDVKLDRLLGEIGLPYEKYKKYFNPLQPKERVREERVGIDTTF